MAITGDGGGSQTSSGPTEGPTGSSSGSTSSSSSSTTRDLGPVPSSEPAHWLALNTFRTQAQITADDEVCLPPPAG